MSTSDTQIANMALARLGRKRVDSLAEISNEATQCNLFFGHLKEAALSNDHWGFATKYRTLSDQGAAPPHFTYQYVYPADCIGIQVLNPGDGVRVEYEIAIINDTVSILTNTAVTLLKYSVDVSSSLFPATFTEYLSLWLAHKIATPLTKNFKLARDLLTETYQSRLHALSVNANQQYAVHDIAPKWITDR